MGYGLQKDAQLIVETHHLMTQDLRPQRTPPLYDAVNAVLPLRLDHIDARPAMAPGPEQIYGCQTKNALLGMLSILDSRDSATGSGAP